MFWKRALIWTQNQPCGTKSPDNDLRSLPRRERFKDLSNPIGFSDYATPRFQMSGAEVVCTTRAICVARYCLFGGSSGRIIEVDLSILSNTFRVGFASRTFTLGIGFLLKWE